MPTRGERSCRFDGTHSLVSRAFVVLFALAILAPSFRRPLRGRRALGSSAAKESLVGFDSFVNEAIQAWEVPGLAIAIVKNGEVILAEGFGLRDVEKKLPVTPKTLFAIGSCTKAFTTFVMGTLVDEGKLDWDKPVRTYIPELRMHDRVASELITPRDLVTHRSGLPRHDLRLVQRHALAQADRRPAAIPRAQRDVSQQVSI